MMTQLQCMIRFGMPKHKQRIFFPPLLCKVCVFKKKEKTLPKVNCRSETLFTFFPQAQTFLASFGAQVWV